MFLLQRAAKLTRRRIVTDIQTERRVTLGPTYHPPHAVKETLMKDHSIVEAIAAEAKATGESDTRVANRVYSIFTEIVSNYRYRTIEVLYVALSWFFSRGTDGIDYHENELHQVREEMKKRPVVFVPCHRSHLDYLVIPYILFIHDLVTPHFAAGINLAFWPVGPILRSGGAFFIRRTFRGEHLYALCLRRYVEFLIKNRFNLTFFIEGTRSRSGKMLPPSYGILKMVLESLNLEGSEDIALIPVSLCYDEVLEESSLRRELSGGNKTKESAQSLLRSRKLIKKNLGKSYIRFGASLSATALYPHRDTAEEKQLLLQKAAFTLCKAINDTVPITPKSLLCAAWMGAPDSTLTLAEAIARTHMLANYVKSAGYALSVPDKSNFQLSLENAFRKLIKAGTLQIIDNLPPRRYVVSDMKRRIQLNYYKNNAIHALVVPSISLLALFRTVREAPSFDHFYHEFLSSAKQLRNFLKFEFFFSPTLAFLSELHKALIHFGLTGSNQETKLSDRESFSRALSKIAAAESEALTWMRLVGDSLEGLWLVLHVLTKSTIHSWDKKALTDQVLQEGTELQKSHALRFPEAVSVTNCSNALLFFQNQKLLSIVKEKQKTEVHWGGNHDKTAIMLKELESYLRLYEGPLFHSFPNHKGELRAL